MGITGADMLIENVPMPEFAIAAEVKLSARNSAHRHADVFQFRLAAIEGWSPAGKERLDPGGIQFFVGRNQLIEIGRFKRARHDRHAGSQERNLPFSADAN